MWKDKLHSLWLWVTMNEECFVWIIAPVTFVYMYVTVSSCKVQGKLNSSGDAIRSTSIALFSKASHRFSENTIHLRFIIIFIRTLFSVTGNEPVSPPTWITQYMLRIESFMFPHDVFRHPKETGDTIQLHINSLV